PSGTAGRSGAVPDRAPDRPTRVNELYPILPRRAMSGTPCHAIPFGHSVWQHAVGGVKQSAAVWVAGRTITTITTRATPPSPARGRWWRWWRCPRPGAELAHRVRRPPHTAAGHRRVVQEQPVEVPPGERPQGVPQRAGVQAARKVLHRRPQVRRRL